MTRRYEGANWLRRNLPKGATLSEFGARVADLLGEWAHGIYHLEDSVRSPKTVWEERYVDLCLSSGFFGGGLATHDNDALTRLVFLAHDACIRVSIEARTFHHLTLYFHPRAVREGFIAERHPTIEAALARHRAAHPIEGVQP